MEKSSVISVIAGPDHEGGGLALRWAHAGHLSIYCHRIRHAQWKCCLAAQRGRVAFVPQRYSQHEARNGIPPQKENETWRLALIR